MEYSDRKVTHYRNTPQIGPLVEAKGVLGVKILVLFAYQVLLGFELTVTVIKFS